MLKPGWLASETVAGVALSHAGPTGTGSPDSDRLVICRVMLEEVVTAPVFRSTFPVVGPFWMKATVAVTGIRPSSLNDPVAGGRLRLAVTLPLLRFTLDRSVPGPRGTVAFAALMKVLPFTGYLTLIVVPADATAGVAATMTAVRNPAREITVAPRTARVRKNRFMRSPWSRVTGGMNGDSSCENNWGSHRVVPGSADSPVAAPHAASSLSCSLRTGDGLRWGHGIGAGELGGIAAVDQAGAAVDVEHVQG